MAVITVLGVLVVLVLLLRAIVAPIYLVLTVLLSYLSTIGLTSWLYQSVFGQPGVNFFLPLMVFVLLVALGSDYNIFLMSRVREESERPADPRRHPGRVRAHRRGHHVGRADPGRHVRIDGVGAPLVVLFQIGVAVAVGVLIDTFVVRSILVPGADDAGRRPCVVAVARAAGPGPGSTAPVSGHQPVGHGRGAA